MIFDLSSDDFIINPYSFYEKMRKIDGPVEIKQAEGISSIKSVLLFSKYKDVIEVYKETNKISNNMFRVREDSEENTFFKHMMNTDGSQHNRLRSSVSQHFSSKYITNLKPIITNICNELINNISEKEKFDLIDDYAEQIPILVIAELLGISDADLVQMRKWSKTIGQGVDTVTTTPEDIESTKIALQNFLLYIKEYITHRKKTSRNQMIDDLISLEEENKLSENELYSMISFLFAAGHETTINLIGNGLWLLLSNKNQLEILKDDFSLMPKAVEEILRFESPKQRSSFRITTEPVNINGCSIEPGTQISLALGSANRDESIFENPNEFNILRKFNPHVAFGVGKHNCLGKHLARLEASIALEVLIKSFPDLELVSRNPNWDGRSLFRGLRTLLVKKI